MKIIEMTKMSSKGQVIIPMEFRRKMGLVDGAKLMGLSDGENLLLKPISAPKESEFQSLIEENRKLSGKIGLKKKDLPRAIKKNRDESCCNVLVGSIFWRGTRGNIIDLWVQNQIKVAVSPEIFKEYKRVFKVISKY